MERFVKMNEIAVAAHAGLFKTVVGSCIALCLWDSLNRVGGMGHIMLPQSNGDAAAPAGKYADTAVKALVALMMKQGGSVKNMQATCVGGASMFQNHMRKFESVGSKNYRMVQKELAGYGIPIVTQAVGGTSGRKVKMDCATGAVTISMLLKSWRTECV